MPIRIASGRRSALANYNRNDHVMPERTWTVADLAVKWKGYVCRITRSLPVSGVSDPETARLYEDLAAIHHKTIAQCLPGSRPSSVHGPARDGLTALTDKHKLTSSNAGKRKIVSVTSISPIGLDMNELELPTQLMPGMVLEVETAFYIPTGKGIAPAWQEDGMVLRDVIVVTEGAPRSLTGKAPASVESAVKMVKTTAPKD